MNEHRTRYGDLTRDAARHLTAAAITLTDGPFPNLAAASAAVSAYADLHDALYRLGWQLHGGPTSAALVPAAEHRQERESATLELLDQIGRIATRNYATRAPRTGVAGHWHRAAVELRTATDLLSTHQGRLGAPRTPDSPNLTDPLVAGPAWAEYSDLARTAAAVGEALAFAAHATGASPQRVRGLSWAGERITRAAQRLHCLVGARGDPTWLRDLAVANPPVRTSDVLLELTDRLHRVHTAAWTHTRSGTMTVPTLTDLAAAGVMVHAATHRALTTGGVDSDTLEAIAAHGRAWRQIHAGLSVLRSIDPVPGGMRADLHAIARLLPQAESDPRSDRVLGLLVEACRSQARVADWSAHALQDLAGQRRVYLLGRELDDDDISEDPDYIASKLGNTLTAAPSSHVIVVLTDYASVTHLTVDRTLGWVSLVPASPGPRQVAARSQLRGPALDG